MQGPLVNDLEHLMQRARSARSELRSARQAARRLREESTDTRLALRLELLARMDPRTGRDGILNAAVDVAVDALDADCGNIQRVYHGRGLELVAQRGFADPFLDYFAYVDDTTTACGAALRAGELVCVEDVTESRVFRNSQALEQLLVAGVRAVSSMPLRSGTGEVVGMLSVHYRAPRAHAAGDRLRMQTLARALGQVIGR